MSERKELNYIGIDENNKFVCVTTPTNPDLSKEIAKWIRQGLSVERCDDDFIRKNFGDILPVGIMQGR